jgi:hypothetical protein
MSPDVLSMRKVSPNLDCEGQAGGGPCPLHSQLSQYLHTVGEGPSESGVT